MNQPILKRLIRLAVGLSIPAVLLLAFLSVQTLPATDRAQAAGEISLIRPGFTVSETETAVSRTAFAQTVIAAGTQTAAAGAQTAVAGTQTAIARTLTAIAQPTGTALYVDRLEPNDALEMASTTTADATALCSLTLWPTGDLDFFKFVGKPGLVYEIITDNLDPGLDTMLTVYDHVGNQIGSNDDFQFGSRESRVVISVFVEGFYYARVVNKEPTDPTNKKYCFEVNEIQGTATPTPLPSATRVPGADACEYNGSIESACLIGTGQTYQMNFVPIIGEGPDNDYYRLWVKAGFSYTCETLDLASVNDTNMILYDRNGNPFSPPIGNDDRTPGDKSSRVTLRAGYTGWLYVLVGPVPEIVYASSHLYTYGVRCEESFATVTPTPTNTRPPTTGGTGGTGGFPPPASPTPLGPTITAAPPPTQAVFLTPTPTPRPVVIIQPLPSATPSGPQQQPVSLSVTLYYDANSNFTPELTEGIVDVAVALYDSATGQLLAFGYTNDAGTVAFDPILTSSAVRVSVPFLSFNQLVIGGSANILIRLAPQPLPFGIP
jgi:hypothetical protein